MAMLRQTSAPTDTIQRGTEHPPTNSERGPMCHETERCSEPPAKPPAPWHRNANSDIAPLASNSVPTGKLFSSDPPIATPTRKSEGAPIETRMGARIDSNPKPTKNPTGPLPRPTTPLFTPPSRARMVNLLVLSVILCVRRRHVSDKAVPICFQVCCPCQHSRLQQQPSLIFRQLGVVTARTLLQC